MTAFTDIPLVDIAALGRGDPAADRAVAEAIFRASRDVGFFYIVNHGVPAPAIARAVAAAEGYFALPETVKQRVSVACRPCGFFRVGGGTKISRCQAGPQE